MHRCHPVRPAPAAVHSTRQRCTPKPPLGPQRSGVGPAAPAFTQLLSSIRVPIAWTARSQCAAPSPPWIGPKKKGCQVATGFWALSTAGATLVCVRVVPLCGHACCCWPHSATRLSLSLSQVMEGTGLLGQRSTELGGRGGCDTAGRQFTKYHEKCSKSTAQRKAPSLRPTSSGPWTACSTARTSGRLSARHDPTARALRAGMHWAALHTEGLSALKWQQHINAPFSGILAECRFHWRERGLGSRRPRVHVLLAPLRSVCIAERQSQGLRRHGKSVRGGLPGMHQKRGSRVAGRGSGTQPFVYQKSPKSIFPSVNFSSPHDEIWVGEPPKVRCRPATLLQPRPPSHGLHCHLSSCATAH